MRGSSPGLEPAFGPVEAAPLWPLLFLGAVLFAACLTALQASVIGGAGIAALAAALSAAIWRRALLGRLPPPQAIIQDFVVVALLAASVDGGVKLWQAPSAWGETLVLTASGAGLAVCLYMGAVLWSLARRRRHISLVAALGFLTAPFLVNLLLLLGSGPLLSQLGGWASFNSVPPGLLQIALGRAIILLLFSEIVFTGAGLLMDRRWTRDARLHAILLLCAAHAAITPLIADFGGAGSVAALPSALRVMVVVAAASAAQAGLWAQTFLITGMIMDALQRRRPAYFAAVAHWREGAGKGAMYGGLFMLLMQAAALLHDKPAARDLLQAHPVISAMAGGVLLFCLARTIIESFDSSPPFFSRLWTHMTDPVNYLRGVLLGAGLGAVVATQAQDADGLARFLFGFTVGALVYAGADFLADILSIIRGPRRKVQGARVYGLGVALGGVIGGGLAWYFDAGQIAVVAERLHAYAVVSFAASGKPAAEYVIYPLFSRWGAIDLGGVSGGVRLFYNDSLSGVINWSIAAPLFSINLVVLTALFERRLDPLRRLFSAPGLTGMLEQTIRVQRWGLWMAPVIQSFLRMAPDPSWYNQDGAVRSMAATIANWTMGQEAFRRWSFDVFLGLLAYDWLRVMIWFDHMGLRVASLVNLSFVGGDKFDEWAARYLGHGSRTRVLPEGVRRFATWAPLLIPFFIPRGPDWDYVWSGAEQLRRSGGEILPAVSAVLAGYSVAAFMALGAGLLVRRINSIEKAQAVAPSSTPPAHEVLHPPRPFSLGNGQYALDFDTDGRSFSRVFSAVRKTQELDITRRPEDPLDVRGKFFYLQDEAGGGHWSLARAPAGVSGPDYSAAMSSRDTARITNSHDGIVAEAEITLAADDPVELWRIRLTNTQNLPRVLILTSYQELALNVTDAYRRQPDYNAIHAGTWFVRGLNAILARNRLLLEKGRSSNEVAFHAAGETSHVRLTGYEDSRARFIGRGTLRKPDALSHKMRTPKDEGLLYSFDPAASLQLRIELAPNASVEINFADGYARDAQQAAFFISRYLKHPLPDKHTLGVALARQRNLLPAHVSQPAAFAFSADGSELRLTPDTPRPWAHVLANQLGFGAMLSNDGAMYSFSGNAQQNGISRFTHDTVTAQNLAQTIYVRDIATGVTDTPFFAPHRRADARHEVVFGRGYAIFRKSTAAYDLDLSVFVPPDQPVELRLLRIRNHRGHTAKFRVVPYTEIALAETPLDSLGKIESRLDAVNGMLLFSNPHNDFVKGWAFAASSLAMQGWETVRARFAGGDRDLTHPYMVEHGLSDAQQADDGRCIAALVGELDVPPGGEVEIVIMLGQTQTPEQAAALVHAYRDPAATARALDNTKRWWDAQLSVVRIETNRPDFDRMVNDWLPYQVLCARLWGRIGPNQRGGAFGYRDQLQDALPLLLTHPEVSRRQILLHAGQQFLEGDVLKWWHQSAGGATGLGQRTASGDPHLWLPYVVARYVAATGNIALLDHKIAFLEGKKLPRGERHLLFVPRRSRDSASVYEHCRRAVERALAHFGRNGLPLTGASDWNDGFDKAGEKGRGESIWLGFFLHDVLCRFAELAGVKESEAAKARYLQLAATLRKSLDHMWRGDRFVRLITDAGEEFSPISALSGAWPVLSGAVDLERGAAAVEAALAKLEREDMVLLLDAPFDEHSSPYPGRIGEYPPGVRENGGQYSHGVSWLVDALIRLSELAVAGGRRDQANQFRKRAAEIWIKISPLDTYASTAAGEKQVMYGLAPHQQPADVYFGPGYEGRGGWSWYTGAAARMLSAAYEIIDLRLENGVPRLGQGGFSQDGPITLKRVLYRGRNLDSKI